MMPKIHPMLGSSLVIFSLAIGVALAVRLGAIPGGDIYVEMKLAPAAQSSQTITLPLTLTLRNPSGRVQTRAAKNTCALLRWFVLDRRGAFVQSVRAQPDCTRAAITRAFKPWEAEDETFNLSLDSRRFERGQEYFLVVEFWGLKEQSTFIAP